MEIMSHPEAKRVYLDYPATTPVDPRVVDAMLPFFTECYGNAASTSHDWGWEAERAVEDARSIVAEALHARESEIIFTSGATESNNLALKGVAQRATERRHLVTVTTEHSSVLEVMRQLERDGFEVTYLPVQPDGLLDLERVRETISHRTLLISVMLVNNEIGVIQPVADIAQMAHEHGILVHTDATQAVGKIPVDVRALKVDLLSFSAHKFYGPKGTGGLYLQQTSPKIRLKPLFQGGGQEYGLRSGTLNVPGIVGLGKALELCLAEMAAEQKRLQELRHYLEENILKRIPDAWVNGHPHQRVPYIVSLTIPGVAGEALLLSLKQVAVSAGSACASGGVEPSHVLRALGVGDSAARSSLRLGLGRFTTREDIDFALDYLTETVQFLSKSTTTLSTG
ncbi:MAG: cysteine desulfurase [Gemmatimonadetes bacterium]|nr:MAG: cysteine desulfurase [Gemmatimonadota bacterium]